MAFIHRRGLLLGAAALGFAGLTRPVWAQAPLPGNKARAANKAVDRASGIEGRG